MKDIDEKINYKKVLFLSVAIITILFVAVFVILKNKKPAPVFVSEPKQKTPAEIAKEALAPVEDKNPSPVTAETAQKALTPSEMNSTTDIREAVQKALAPVKIK